MNFRPGRSDRRRPRCRSQPGIIHRDVKPGNTSSPGASQSNSRFCLAKVITTTTASPKPLAYRSSTAVGVTQDILTTPASPLERLRTCRPSRRAVSSSMHAPTLQLRNVLTKWRAARPFPGETSAAVSDSILHATPPPPSRLEPRSPQRARSHCPQSVGKDPNKRFASARKCGRSSKTAPASGWSNQARNTHPESAA